MLGNRLAHSVRVGVRNGLALRFRQQLLNRAIQVGQHPVGASHRDAQVKRQIGLDMGHQVAGLPGILEGLGGVLQAFQQGGRHGGGCQAAQFGLDQDTRLEHVAQIMGIVVPPGQRCGARGRIGHKAAPRGQGLHQAQGFQRQQGLAQRRSGHVQLFRQDALRRQLLARTQFPRPDHVLQTARDGLCDRPLVPNQPAHRATPLSTAPCFPRT